MNDRYWEQPRQIIHARKTATSVALCGLKETSLWTTQKCAVSCASCLAEIELRLAARAARKK